MSNCRQTRAARTQWALTDGWSRRFHRRGQQACPYFGIGIQKEAARRQQSLQGYDRRIQRGPSGRLPIVTSSGAQRNRQSKAKDENTSETERIADLHESPRCAEALHGNARRLVDQHSASGFGVRSYLMLVRALTAIVDQAPQAG